MRFAIGDTDFLLDGEPHRVLSGAIHYFRVHPDLWQDRIRKARLMGLNTVETYVAWNAHEATPGDFDFTGGLDLGRFLDLVAAEGMHAIVRPGPYICAEWTNGGLPYWLFTDGTVGIRRDEPQFLAAVSRYLDALAPILVPRQIDAGGPIVLVQVENEYGAYGSDPVYLTKLEADAPCDRAHRPLHQRRPADGHHARGRFAALAAQDRVLRIALHGAAGAAAAGPADRTADVLGVLGRLVRQLGRAPPHHPGRGVGVRPGRPARRRRLGQRLHVPRRHELRLHERRERQGRVPADRDVVRLRRPARRGRPTDGEVPRVPHGDRALRARTGAAGVDAARRIRPLPAAGDAPSNGLEARPTPATDVTVRLDRSTPLASLLPQLASWTTHQDVPTFDALGAASGFVLYRTEVDLPNGGVLTVGTEVRDRVLVSVDGRPVGVLEREHHDRAIALPPVTGTLELLVEDQGRVDYGTRIGEPKGLIGGVSVDGEPLERWTVSPLALDPLPEAALDVLRALPITDGSVLAGPVVALGSFDLDVIDDRYLALDGFRKGVAWVNGFCLGRYWSRGPQTTLAVPGPVLRAGRNEVVVFELHASASRTVTLRTEPDLGHTEA